MRAAWLPLLMLAPAAAFHAWLVRKPPRSGLDASSTSESSGGIFHYDMTLTPLVLNSESALVGASCEALLRWKEEEGTAVRIRRMVWSGCVRVAEGRGRGGMEVGSEARRCGVAWRTRRRRC